jgi:putative ABC transport system permease protein
MIPLSYNLRSLVVRKTTTIAAALGIALVVFVFATVQMLAAGIRRTLATTGRPDNAIVLSRGSDAELTSSFDESNVALILAKPGVAMSPDGKLLATSEAVAVATMDKADGSGIANVQLRGVRDNALAFRGEIRLEAGRLARPGTDEVLVGRAIRGRFRGIELGQSFELRRNRPVQVVGIFSAGGTSMESEVWVDIDRLRSSFGREALVSSVTARLTSQRDFEAFKASIGQDKQLGFEVYREPAYYEKLSQGTASFVEILGRIIAIFFAVGAAIGAMITMYSSIANREREIGTLRALGFSRIGILISFLIEALALALTGGVVGALASSAMKFVRFSTMNFATWSEIVFSFTVTTSTVFFALAFASALGLAGGFFPALRAARTLPIKALRA